MHTSEAWEEGSLVPRLYQLVLRSCTKCAPCMEHNYFNMGSVQFKQIKLHEQDLYIHALKHDMQEDSAHMPPICTSHVQPLASLSLSIITVI